MVPKRLPDDSEDLKRLLVEAHARADSAENQAATFKARAEVAEAALADLEQQLAAIKRRIFGRRTERVGKGQLSLFGEDADPDAALAAAKAATESKGDTPAPKRQRKRGRRRLPAHLSRIEVTADEPGQTTCNGCGGDLKTIGHEVSDRLEYIPGRFVVLACTRAKRACPACPSEGVCIQPAPVFGLDRALPADGLLAKVITDKFADHLPLTRQAKRFQREAGVDIAVSTMCGWLRQSADLLKHVVEVMAQELREGPFVQSDATGFPILEGSKNQPRRGQLWSFSDGGQVVFMSSMDGTQERPAKFLKGFNGTLLTDGAGAYNLVARSNGVIRAGCWAHARRKFFEARSEAPEKAGYALAQVREIFALERELKLLAPEARARARHETLAEPLARFRQWLDLESRSARPTGAFGKALTYARNQWETLVVFLIDGNVPVDNNASERHLRGPVVGRKNWLFAGSEGGAKTAATCFSIVGSCVLAGIDPYAYLRDILSLLPDAKPAQLKTLTPRAWAARFGPTTP
ncbi:MAG: IS66 family transposase [Planctomycetota bacterium]|jgi:transposase|nr:IS66 family transposase [Planctomycetota bacterium]